MLCWCCKPWSVCAFIISMERLAFLYNNKKTCQKLGMLYVRCIFCDDNFIDIAFKGKGGGAGNPATHFHQQQPIILLKNRLFCVFSFILKRSES